jgi:energy-coupling factor transporter transmembrane protein EcfT
MAAPKPKLPNPTPVPAETETFTSAMRIFGGVAWGTITTLAIAVVLIIIPQVPRPWLWGVIPTWLGLISLGIILQWSVARGECPKCRHHVVVSVQGKRCPECRSYLKAVDRAIIKVA